MSQVIVTNDILAIKREESKLREHKIDRESAFAKWRRDDITGRDPLAMAVGVMAMPVVAFWSLVASCITFSFSVMLGLFKLLGGIFR